jgi:hypothetical protein
MSAADPSDEPEVGQPSLWFLRGVGALTVLLVLWFLVHAIRG